ncbi:YchJ family protein [Thalassotalea sediminis]|uniref:YchJ family protein n=1 Tax=Thalassotalea sediminis TaxID=1759089 RepID=UPI002572A233|nr:YchJ family metal-binding protein [Thalassotalea sediminis]
MLCICGSGLDEDVCCKSIIEKKRVAVFPEQLMRSRYYSYAHNNVDYLYETYADHAKSATLKSEIADWCQQSRWIKLNIHRADAVAIDNVNCTVENENTALKYPIVNFTAYYIYNDTYCQMTEQSRFIVENGQWRYYDGDVIEQKACVKLTRNTSCPCGSGKKYKRCCIG